MLSEGLPLLLTVEEAGELLRIGRTKAYAMATEWRETEGRSGLPVIDLGHVLRVPRRALEDLFGIELPAVPRTHATDKTSHAVASPEPSQSSVSVTTETPATQQSRTTSRNRQRRRAVANQLDLFDVETAAS